MVSYAPVAEGSRVGLETMHFKRWEVAHNFCYTEEKLKCHFETVIKNQITFAGWKRRGPGFV